MPEAAPSPLPAAQAARAVLRQIQPLPVECIPLSEALGRVLAADVRSPIDLPHWDNAAMDGYAARAADLGGPGPVALTVVEEIPAGRFPRQRLGPGQCARIFTGAPIPVGADSVIRQEDTERVAPDRVLIRDARDAGRNVRKAGEDIARGSEVLSRGTPLGPAQLGVLASIAAADVYVHRRPHVAILATGDEVVDVDESDAILAGEKIASSNSYTLEAGVRLAGAEAIPLGIARDDPEDIRRRLAQATTADLLVTTGAVSVGERDYLRSVLADLGLELDFWRARIRPGGPVAFGVVRGLPWIGLPGNPVSTMVTFELFVRPAIRRLLGHTKLFRRVTRVRVGERIETPAPLRHFLRVRLEEGDGIPAAFLTGPQGSGILTSLIKADALLVVPEERDVVQPGDTLMAIPLEEWRHVEEPPF